MNIGEQIATATKRKCLQTHLPPSHWIHARVNQLAPKMGTRKPKVKALSFCLWISERYNSDMMPMLTADIPDGADVRMDAESEALWIEYLLLCSAPQENRERTTRRDSLRG